MARINVYWAFALALTAAAWAASIGLYPYLPATIPTHWNIHGQVDGYGPKASTVFLFPVFMVGMLGLFRALPALSPKDFGVDSVRAASAFVMVVVVGLFAYLHGVILLATWQRVTHAPHPFDLGRALFAGMFLSLGLIGGVLGKVRRNALIGVRVPWTLTNDRVWDETHRLAARTIVVGGLVGFLVAVTGGPLVVAFAALILSVAVPVAYSFVRYKRLEREGTL